MAGPTGPFRRQDRLLRPREFRHVLQRGHRSAARAFVVFVLPSGARSDARPRLGITVSRKVGNAATRNRVKRQIREWFRASRSELEPGSEVVVIGRQAAAELSGSEIASALDDAMRRCRMSAS